jgi:hypothetical protein
MNIIEFVGKELSGEELNKLNGHKSFYKFINYEKTHYDYEYKQGLNIDTHNFNPTNNCSEGGLYFTTIDYIFKFMHYGNYFSEIMIPDDARCYIENNKIKADKIIVLSFIKINELDKLYDINFCTKAVKQNGCAIKHMPEEFKNNFELAMCAVKKNEYLIKDVSDELKNNFEFVMCAVKQNGYAIKYVSEELKNNFELAMCAVKQCGCAIKYVSKKLKNNFKLTLCAVMQNGCALEYVSDELKNNSELAMCAVKQNGNALEHASEELKNTFELVIRAVKENGYAIKYASKRIKKSGKIKNACY